MLPVKLITCVPLRDETCMAVARVSLASAVGFGGGVGFGLPVWTKFWTAWMGGKTLTRRKGRPVSGRFWLAPDRRGLPLESKLIGTRLLEATLESRMVSALER